MKIALVLLACFVSLTWQQNIFWSFPARHIPFYPTFNQDLLDDFPIVAASDPTGPQLYRSNYGHDGQDGVEQRTLEGSIPYQRRQQQAFRSFGMNYLASIILSSLTLSSSSTSYSTTTLSITAGTVVTCFTNTMFAKTDACRRKRDVLTISRMLIGDDGEQNESHSNKGEIERLPREGRDIDPTHLITSSQTEKDLNVDHIGAGQTESSADGFFRSFNRNKVITSILTSYSVYYSTSTRIVENLALRGALACVPTGFKTC